MKEFIPFPKIARFKFADGRFWATHPSIEDYPINLSHFYSSVGCAIEVVGNIHQHADMLK